MITFDFFEKTEQLSIQEVADRYSAWYAIDKNPLEHIRACGVETHFEYKNSGNLFFMRANKTAENYLFNTLVFILDQENEELFCFFQGEEGRANIENYEFETA